VTWACRREIRVLGVAAVVLALGACGGDRDGDATPAAPDPYRRCAEPGLTEAEAGFCEAHDDGRGAGAKDELAAAADAVARRADDGYRLRRWTT
jgi:hypothetical protein